MNFGQVKYSEELVRFEVIGHYTNRDSGCALVVVLLLSKNRGIVAISVVAASVIVRNGTIEARSPCGMNSFVSSCPNQTFCTDGNISRVAFMVADDARTFISRLVDAGLAPSAAEARSEIALIMQGKGSIIPVTGSKRGSSTGILAPGWLVRIAGACLSQSWT